MTKAIKLGPDGMLTILAIPFGGPMPGGKDLDGEHFSAKTDLCLDWFPTQRPLLYHHGLDATIGVTPVGKVDASTAVQDEAGWWVQAQLDQSGRYHQHITKLLAADEEALFASSGSLPHLVRTAKSGEILRWPWVELSLTTTPANPFARVEATAAKAHYLAAGLTAPPTIDPDEARSFDDRVTWLTGELEDVYQLALRLAEGRTKAGRPQFTETRRARLAALLAAHDAAHDAADDLRALLEETAPHLVAEADAASTGKTAPISLNAVYRQALERRAWLARTLTGV